MSSPIMRPMAAGIEGEISHRRGSDSLWYGIQVKCILFYGQNNPVDGAILEVLLRKAVTIHRSLGITVPIPMDSQTVQEAVFQSLFERSTILASAWGLPSSRKSRDGNYLPSILLLLDVA